MDPLNDVPSIVEHPPDVLRVHGAGKVRIAVVGVVLLAVRPARLLTDLQEVVPNEVLGPRELAIGAGLNLRAGLRREHVVDKLREVVLEPALAGLDLLLQEVLLVQEKDHRNCS